MNLQNRVTRSVALLHLLVLAACGGGTDSPAPPVTTPAQAGIADIGSAGGTVNAVLEGGTTLQLTVPAGAVNATTTFDIEPLAAAAGTSGSFTIAPAGVALTQNATLTITFPAAQNIAADTSLVIRTGDTAIPISAPLGTSSRTMTVPLSAAILRLPPVTGAASIKSAKPQAAPAAAPAAAFNLLPVDFAARLTALETEVTRLTSLGSLDQADIVQTIANAVMSDSRGPTEPRVHAVTGPWSTVVCGQQQFSITVINGFSGVDTQTFESDAKAVIFWDDAAAKLNATFAALKSPGETGCASVFIDTADPVRAVLPAFLANVSQALSLLDPTVDSEFNQLFKVRVKELFDLAFDFQALNKIDIHDTAIAAIASQLARVRSIAYTQCRVQRSQRLQANLLTALNDAFLQPVSAFSAEAVQADIQFCGMTLHWVALDTAGAIVQQGDAGGFSPDVTVTAVPVPMPRAATLRVSGPLFALLCPLGLLNIEQLDFSTGPSGGPFTSAASLSPALINSTLPGYLNATPQTFDLTALDRQGVQEIRVARTGGLCDGEFANLNSHLLLTAFKFDFGALQITTTSLPGGFATAPYSFTLAATGGKTPYGWLATGLPTGMAMNAQTGEISGTPATAGTRNVLVSVNSADGQTVQRTLSLAIASGVPNVAGTYVGFKDISAGTFDFTANLSQTGTRLFFDGNLFDLAPSGTLTWVGIDNPAGGHFPPTPGCTFAGTIAGKVMSMRFDCPGTDIPFTTYNMTRL